MEHEEQALPALLRRAVFLRKQQLAESAIKAGASREEAMKAAAKLTASNAANSRGKCGCCRVLSGVVGCHCVEGNLHSCHLCCVPLGHILTPFDFSPVPSPSTPSAPSTAGEQLAQEMAAKDEEEVRS